MNKPAFRQKAESNNPTLKNVFVGMHSITCEICDAVYGPSPSRQDIVQATPSVLELTFMSMCHYCFRCRRPACPACWDAMNGVCGACVQEAHLPFRSSASPLKGILFPPYDSTLSHISDMKQSSMDIPVAPLLVCIRPGRFQQRTGTYESAKATEIAPATPSKRYQPDYIKEQQATAVRKPQPSIVLRSDEIVAPAQEPDDMLIHSGATIFKTIERVLNVILLSVLLCVLVLIILAEFSAGASAQIMQLFHVDIRSEMAYLLYVIQQIRV
jgi:hypothetical protein